MSSAQLLATIPSPPQGVWYLGPIPIRAYALCIIAGIIVAIVWGQRRWRARGGQPGTIVDIAVWAVPFGLVGARIYHVATDWYLYFPDDPLGVFMIWNGGLGIWGGVAGGAIGAWIAARRRGIPLPAVGDAVAPGLLAAQAIGRIGNYFNQELYGGHTELPWGLEVYRRVDPQTGMIDPIGGVSTGVPLPVSPVHPTFLYELLWCLIVAGVVVWADRRFRLGHGRAFALYVAGYTFGRFFIELFFRADDATHVLGVRINVIVSAVVFVAAVIYFLLARRGREDPAALGGTGTVPPDGEDDETTGTDATDARDAAAPAASGSGESAGRAPPGR